jgi:L-fuconate dehydratase
VVVAAVGDHDLRPPSWPSHTAAHRRHALEQLEQLCDVVAVAAGERPGQRDPAAVYEQMVLAASPPAVDRAGTGFRAPFFACR